MKKLNKETLLIRGELEGLKRFIKVAELNKLQMLVDENPQYFYNILPYAYIFNLSNKWIKKFENIVKSNPDEIMYKAADFNRFINTMNKLSKPSYDNGGISKSSGGSSYHHSSGGGGHSGGGGGGGGGRSW